VPDWLLLVAPLLAASLVLLLGFAGCKFEHGELGSPTDLLFYERPTGQGEFYATSGGGISLLGETHTDWRRTWALIVPGGFSDAPYTHLLFYDRTGGEGEFWSTSGAGGISLIGETNTGWRTSWTFILPGRFEDQSNYTDLLFYERRTGQGEFWRSNGDGTISMIGETNTGWRTSWALIVPGKFADGDFTDLLFYERSTGQGEFWRSNGDGTISMIGETNTGWRTSWDLIVPGHFADGDYTGLLFYDRETGQGEFWRSNGDGTISMIGETHTDWRTSWTTIVPGYFGGGYTSLLFYSESEGVGEFYATNGQGGISLLGETHTDWRTTWTSITPGSFD
jgi:hypothetical protein